MSPDTLLLACYEMGHQPLSLALPAAALRQAGVPVRVIDLSLEPLPRASIANAKFVGIAAPMHAALRLGVRAAQEIRRLNPEVHICFYGLYAWLNAEFLLTTLADSVTAGELEESLVSLVLAVQRRSHHGETVEQDFAIQGVSTREHIRPVRLLRQHFPVPDRSDLPDLARYSRYLEDGRYGLSGYVEASRGCLHTCRHCPVVPVYNGRFFVVPLETVLADIRQQVAAGAEHISFGDPDFLNGPGHALKVARALHAEFPKLTFDFTTKVEHILRHRKRIAEFRLLGASFVVSAFESVSDIVLRRLHKGHTRADLDEALAIMKGAGLPVQPTWLPFTPWTSLDDYIDLLTWIRGHQLIGHVPVVQLSIRLLVPPKSALLDESSSGEFGRLDPANYSYAWHHPDPRMDDLQARVAVIAETADKNDLYEAFNAVEQIAYATASRPLPVTSRQANMRRHDRAAPPRLTEDWFC